MAPASYHQIVSTLCSSALVAEGHHRQLVGAIDLANAPVYLAGLDVLIRGLFGYPFD